jgi:hypothetical protein
MSFTMTTPNDPFPDLPPPQPTSRAGGWLIADVAATGPPRGLTHLP